VGKLLADKRQREGLSTFSYNASVNTAQQALWRARLATPAETLIFRNWEKPRFRIRRSRRTLPAARTGLMISPPAAFVHGKMSFGLKSWRRNDSEP